MGHFSTNNLICQILMAYWSNEEISDSYEATSSASEV